MKKLWIFFHFLVISLSCEYNSLKSKIDKELINAIGKGGNTVNFERVSENFDSLLILRPYSNLQKIQKNLKIDLHTLENTNIQQRDDIILFVLLKNNTVVGSAELSRNKYSFKENDVKPYSKKHNFILERGKRGESEVFIILDR